MKYISTRGEAPAIGFLDTVMAGLAPDGGLYCPETWPTFTPNEIDATFSHAAVTPRVQLRPGQFLLELVHGPSLAFKDVAMQLLARLYQHALRTRGRRLTIVCATSGDTGGAAVEAFRGGSNIKVVAMFPDGRISEVQRRYMTTASEANVACLSVAGDFDDCQAILKELFRDTQFANAVDLAAVNSINFARIAAAACDLRSAHRQFRRRLRRIRRLAHGLADRADHRRHQRQRHCRPRHRGGPLRPRPGEGDGQPGHGHPGLLELRAALFRGRAAPG
jgi:threonine synthase